MARAPAYTERSPAPIAQWEWAALGAVAVAALVVRLYAIDRIPAVVVHDECDNLVNVYQILHGKGPGFFGLDWKPQPAASVHLFSIATRASRSLFSLRLVPALLSVVALLPFYLLLRQAVRAPAALLAAWLLAADIWYLHFSRVGWDNVFMCVPVTAAAFCVHAGVRTRRVRSFIWAGVWSACGAYGYPAGRLILPAVLATALAALAVERGGRQRLAAGAVVATATALLLFAAQLPVIFNDWQYFQRRTRFVYVLGGENQTRPAQEKVGIVLANFGRKALQLFAEQIPLPKVEESPDRYVRVDDGAFTRATAAMIIGGLLISITSVRWFSETWHWWIFLLIPFAGTQALTIGSLNGARGIIFVPIVYLFVGLTLQQVWQVSRRWGRAGAAIVVGGALTLSVWTTVQYFRWVQSPELVQALQPAIPVNEFPLWRDRVFQWTRDNEGFYNLVMWEADKRQMIDAHQ